MTTDGTGAQGTVEFTAMDQPSKVTSAAVVHAGEASAVPEVSAYAYDPAQHLVAETKPMGAKAGAAAGSYSTKYVLDENGQPVVSIRRSRGGPGESDEVPLALRVRPGQQPHRAGGGSGRQELPHPDLL